ncbi:MAG: GNAT family N-acetyltransferase [Xanthobacteraceae bacterium]
MTSNSADRVTSATALRALRSAVLAFNSDAGTQARGAEASVEASSDLHLMLYDGFAAAEAQWRQFETIADCTPFQTFDWLSAWQRHIGDREGVLPAIAAASFANGDTAFILPLAIEPGRTTRRLCWLGQDVNDYNAPLIARDLPQRLSTEGFRAAWRELLKRMQRDPMRRHDWVELEKMPQAIGGQINPFFHLPHATNPSGAHFAKLGADWKTFYYDKRSSATRRRDRAKRRHLSEFGEVAFATSFQAGDVRCTLEALMAQKNRLLAQRGIGDMFARPGWREFFLDVATNPATRDRVHVSRVQVGATCAAANVGVVFGETYYHVLASYDDGPLAHYGPGALHLRELLAYAIGRGLKQFDFTIGDEPYKREWSDADVVLADYARPARWRGWPAYAISAVRRPIKRFIKQTPWAWRVVSRLRRAVGRLLERTAHRPGSGSSAI